MLEKGSGSTESGNAVSDLGTEFELGRRGGQAIAEQQELHQQAQGREPHERGDEP